MFDEDGSRERPRARCWAWVEYAAVDVGAGGTFVQLVEDFVVSTGTSVRYFGTWSASRDDGVVERACVLFWSCGECSGGCSEWSTTVCLGLPAECVVNMETKLGEEPAREWVDGKQAHVVRAGPEMVFGEPVPAQRRAELRLSLVSCGFGGCPAPVWRADVVHCPADVWFVMLSGHPNGGALWTRALELSSGEGYSVFFSGESAGEEVVELKVAFEKAVLQIQSAKVT